MAKKTRHELRCEACSRRGLLGYFGLTADGEFYVHVKATKQGQIVNNLVMYGECDLQCRYCLRWTRIRHEKRQGFRRDVFDEPPGEALPE